MKNSFAKMNQFIIEINSQVIKDYRKEIIIYKMDPIFEDDIKKCPYCAEEIKAEAIKCKHCGENLEEEDFWAESDRKKRERQNQIPAPQKLNAGTAAVLSLFFPGAGQIYRGKIGKGIIWFILVIIGYFFLVVPGIVLHIICIFNAYDSE